MRLFACVIKSVVCVCLSCVRVFVLMCVLVYVQLVIAFVITEMCLLMLTAYIYSVFFLCSIALSFAYDNRNARLWIGYAEDCKWIFPWVQNFL